MPELNTGSNLEESKKLVAYWHTKWAEVRDDRDRLQTVIDFYDAPPHVQYTVQLYAQLAPSDREKIDGLMSALLNILRTK